MDHFDKVAALRVKNVEHLVSELINTKKFTAEEAQSAAKKIYDSNSGLISSAVTGALKKLPKPAKKLGEKLEGGISEGQRRLVNSDLKAGGYLADKLKNRKQLKKLFINHHNIEVPNTAEGKAKEILQVETPSLLAPINNAKKVALPTVGAFYLTDKIEGMKSYNNTSSKEGGENLVKNSFNRSDMIEKIAETLNGYDSDRITINVETKGLDNEVGKEFAKLASRAKDMLKQASEELKAGDELNEKLANENKTLNLSFIAKCRSGRSVKLAEMMNDKGIIKKADIDLKVDEIMEMDDKAYNILYNTVSDISKNASDESGITNLTFLNGEGNIDNIKNRPTFADSIGEALSSIKG